MENQLAVVGQTELSTKLSKIFDIFEASECEIRPHFFLTGPSGSGKTLTIASLCEARKIGYFEINAAQLTKEGTSGNSLSKALSGLLNMQSRPTVCFVDEFDKLFISGNSNTELAHETTNGVQNEFLKVLEADMTSVFGDYGKYINVNVKNVLFVFAGAFNGEEGITIDRLREFGIKTEFLGRVGLTFEAQRLSLDDLISILETSPLLDKYCELTETTKEKPVSVIKKFISENYELNTLGARIINTLIHKYFINEGNLEDTEVKKSTFQKKLKLVSKD